MNTDLAASPNTFEQRLLSVERGVRLFGVTLLLLSSVPNLVLAASITTYAEALPAMVRLVQDKALLYYVFAHPGYLIALAVLWPVAGTWITLRGRDPFRALLAASIYLVLVMVQFTLTWLAFLAPLRVSLQLLRAP